MPRSSFPHEARAWFIWTVGVAGYVLAVTNRTSLSAVGIDAAQRFGTDASTLSLFAVVQLAVYGGMQLPIGVVLDRWGARPIMTIGMLLMAAGQLTMALSSEVGIAILARVLIGAGDAAVFPSVLRLVATWFPAQRGPLMVQLTGIVGQSGQLLAVLPLAALLHATSWTIAFGSVAGLGILFTILVLAFIRNHPPDLPADVTVDTDTGTVRAVTSQIDAGTGIRAAWAHPGTRLAFWSHFTTPFAGTAFVLLWGMPFLTAAEGLSLAQASGIMSVYVLVGMALGPIMGELSRRIPTRRSRVLVLPAVAAQAVAWLVVLAWPGPAPLWLLYGLAFALAMGGPALDDRVRPRPYAQSRASPLDGDGTHERGWLPRLAHRGLPHRSRARRAGCRHARDLLARGLPPRVPHAGAALAAREHVHRDRAQTHPHPHGTRRAATPVRAQGFSSTETSTQSGYFGGRPSPDDVPVTRRLIQGPRCSRK